MFTSYIYLPTSAMLINTAVLLHAFFTKGND